MLASTNLGPLALSLLLATVTTVLLMLGGAPLAWHLAHSRRLTRPLIEALVGLPLVLPPTVLGFYLLLLLSPRGPVGAVWQALGGEPLVFTFTSLVIGSVIYSLPFVVQPLLHAFEAIGAEPVEVAATLGAGPLDRFFSVGLARARRALVTAALLGFAHTLGEFGVVLMVGGNIPGRTQVLSIAIFEHVEALEYRDAHVLSALLLGFSLTVMLVVYLGPWRAARRGA